MQELDPAPGVQKADRARSRPRQVGQKIGRLAHGRAAGPQGLVGERRVPHGDAPAGARGAVGVDQGEVLEPGEALGELRGVGHGGRGQQEARPRAVGARDPAQPAQDIGHVGAEYATIDVGLVDDHDREVGHEVGPGAVVGQDPDVEHVGIGEDDVGAPANRAAGLARGVPVVDRGAHALGQAERGQRARLVLGQRLGRVQVQGAGPGIAEQDLECGQVEAQRLARGGPGGDDHRALPRRLQRLPLVGVEALDAGALECAHELGPQVAGEGLESSLACGLDRLLHQAAVVAPVFQQGGPGLGCARDGHRLRHSRPARGRPAGACRHPPLF